MRQGRVFVHNKYAGILTEENRGHYLFEYDEEYLVLKDATPVCLAMPLSKRRYESDTLFPFFANLLSEGENRKYQSHLLRVDERDDFGLLLLTAGYDTIGCVTVIPVETL